MFRKYAVAAAVLAVVLILSPYLVPISMAAIFAVLFHPAMKALDKGWFPNSLAAALFTLAVTVLVFLPIATLSVVGVKTGLNKLQQIKHTKSSATLTQSEDFVGEMLATTGVKKILVKASSVVSIDPDAASDQLHESVTNFLSHLVDVLAAYIAGIPSMAVSFTVFLFSIFYFLADQKRVLVTVKHYSVFSPNETNQLMGAFTGLCRSVILASIASGFAQALIAALVCVLLGIRPAFTIFLVIFIFSFIPLLGSFPMMLFLTISQFVAGQTASGMILIAATFVVGTVDNFIRPYVIRGGCNLHPLLGFTSALAGLEIFGITGVFIGPVVCGMGIEVMRLGRESS